MYGLLLDAIQKFLREKYGEAYWTNIRRRAKLQNHWFVTHEVGGAFGKGKKNFRKVDGEEVRAGGEGRGCKKWKIKSCMRIEFGVHVKVL